MDIHGILVLKARTPCCGLKVAIDPEYGRRGLSRRLLSVAEQQARSRDLSELRLYANELMVENTALYSHLGYQEVERRSDNAFHRVFMRKPVTRNHVQVHEVRAGDGAGQGACVDRHRHLLRPARSRAVPGPTGDRPGGVVRGALAGSTADDTFRRVADLAGEVVGLMSATLQEPFYNAPHQLMRELGWRRVSINALGVRATLGRRGTGSQLLPSREMWARSLGARIAALDTYVTCHLLRGQGAASNLDREDLGPFGWHFLRLSGAGRWGYQKPGLSTADRSGLDAARSDRSAS
jgi:GNAT superfamily N-acetyltransferase